MRLEGSGRRAALCALLAALAYAVVALFVLRAVLPAPGRLLPYPALLDWNSTPRADLTRLDHRDQSMVVSVVTRNAAILTSEPWKLLDGFGQCYPMPRSYTLGEHMFGTGLLAAVPYLLTGDPILTFNGTLFLTLWIPGLTMYALSWSFTRSAASAFVAGLLFLLVPGRIIDPSHPYVHGDLWAPLMLLFLHRLFTVGRWRDALLFALFLSLEVFESLYPLLGCSMLVLVYGGRLAWLARSRLLALLPKIAVAAAIVVASAWLVLGPYLETRETWGLLEGRTSTMLRLWDYRWGSIYFPGALILGFAALGVVDRLRRPRPVRGDDPRLPILLAGIVILWASTVGFPVPFTDLVLPSPIALLKPYVPGLSAVRALTAVGIVSNLAWAFLAGYGFLRLIERRSRPVAVGAAAVTTALAVAFLFHGRFARPMYATWSFKLSAWTASPAARDVALLRRVAEGAVLDVPFPEMEGASSINLAQHLLLNSYDPRATAACYNSFVSPVQRQIVALAARLPQRDASDALAALGFGTVMVEKDRLEPAALQSLFDGLRVLDNWERMRPVGRSGRFLAYRLSTPTPVRADFGSLAPAAAEPARVVRRAGHATVELPFANPGREIFRHPDPIEPRELIVTWRDESGHVAKEARVRELLPLAIAPGAQVVLPLELPAPEQPGAYAVSVARADAPQHTLATRQVELVDS
ncbi:MAG: hypothetical protein AB1689_29035 [Thermodesulfobacteriota bacterium]